MLITSEKDEHIYHLILNWWQLQEITNLKLWQPLNDEKYTTHKKTKKKKKKKNLMQVPKNAESPFQLNIQTYINIHFMQVPKSDEIICNKGVIPHYKSQNRNLQQLEIPEMKSC
jgi:hypothetical protein